MAMTQSHAKSPPTHRETFDVIGLRFPWCSVIAELLKFDIQHTMDMPRSIVNWLSKECDGPSYMNIELKVKTYSTSSSFQRPYANDPCEYWEERRAYVGVKITEFDYKIWSVSSHVECGSWKSRDRRHVQWWGGVSELEERKNTFRRCTTRNPWAVQSSRVKARAVMPVRSYRPSDNSRSASGSEPATYVRKLNNPI